MFKRLLLASVAWCASATLSSADSAWHLPDGMEWKGPGTGACDGVSHKTTVVKGCYFGAVDSDEHAGAVFYRVCEGKLESQPFLLLDYVTFTSTAFFPDYPGLTYTEHLSSEGIDPLDLYHQYLQIAGPCPPSERV